MSDSFPPFCRSDGAAALSCHGMRSLQTGIGSYHQALPCAEHTKALLPNQPTAYNSDIHLWVIPCEVIIEFVSLPHNLALRGIRTRALPLM
jgi:hypothetical protein